MFHSYDYISLLVSFVDIPVSLDNLFIAVGLPVTQQPPHRSRRAVFPHRAPQKYSLPQSSLDQLKLSRLGPSSFDSWSLYLVVLEQLVKAYPIVAAALASPVEPLE